MTVNPFEIRKYTNFEALKKKERFQGNLDQDLAVTPTAVVLKHQYSLRPCRFSGQDLNRQSETLGERLSSSCFNNLLDDSGTCYNLTNVCLDARAVETQIQE